MTADCKHHRQHHAHTNAGCPFQKYKGLTTTGSCSIALYFAQRLSLAGFVLSNTDLTAGSKWAWCSSTVQATVHVAKAWWVTIADSSTACRNGSRAAVHHASLHHCPAGEGFAVRMLHCCVQPEFLHGPAAVKGLNDAMQLTGVQPSSQHA